MVASSVALTVRERNRQASTAAVQTSLCVSLLRLPASACLPTNFSKTSREQKRGGRREISKSSSASVEAANINGANDLTQGNVNSFLLLFADGIKEYLSRSFLILDRDNFSMNCYHFKV